MTAGGHKLRVPRRHLVGCTLGLAVAAALAAAPLTTTFMQHSGAHSFGLPVRTAVPTAVRGPPRALQVLYFPEQARARVACAAGASGPGDAPEATGEEGEEAVAVATKKGKKVKLGPSEFKRVRERIEFLKKIKKGKFMPYGPKPGDKLKFWKVYVMAQMDAKVASNSKIVAQVTEELRRITGRHPDQILCNRDDNMRGYRKGTLWGLRTTLKGKLMFDFLTRLNTIVLPRVRDFEGLYPNDFDASGNYNLYLDSQEPFRELDEMIEQRDLVHGFYITILNSAFTQPDGLKLMKSFGFPFGDPRVKVKKEDQEAKEDEPWYAKELLKKRS